MSPGNGNDTTRTWHSTRRRREMVSLSWYRVRERELGIMRIGEDIGSHQGVFLFDQAHPNVSHTAVSQGLFSLCKAGSAVRGRSGSDQAPGFLIRRGTTSLIASTKAS